MIDRNLYRHAYTDLRRWSEGKAIARLRADIAMTPRERFRRFADLVDFGRALCPTRPAADRAADLATWGLYHERVLRMETWRRSHATLS